MPLTVCRCCGGKMEPDQAHQNPNICASCERLLEDESPVIMAKINGSEDSTEDILDQPENQPEVQPETTRSSSLQPTRKSEK